MIACKHCSGSCTKYGYQTNRQQRCKCKVCGKTQLGRYRNLAYNMKEVQSWIAGLIKEGCGIRSMARLLRLSINTIVRYIKIVASEVSKPRITLKPEVFEVDELRTFVGTKRNPYWVAYALSRRTGKVIEFIVGKRSKATLRTLIDKVLLYRVKGIYTDKLTTYRNLIPKTIHKACRRCTNHIERHDLNLRTHLKRLSRRTMIELPSYYTRGSCTFQVEFFRRPCIYNAVVC